jgi:hypothetical protein
MPSPLGGRRCPSRNYPTPLPGEKVSSEGFFHAFLIFDGVA